MINGIDYLDVEVTQEDIDTGQPFKSECCPVAKAVRRVTRHEFISIGPSIATIGPFTLGLPKEVTKFVEDFDFHGKSSVRPFSFKLSREYQCATPTESL